MAQAPFHYETQKLVNHLYRQWNGKMVTSLTRYFGLQQLEVAEDIVHDTFETAIQTWETKGIPHEPVNWLFRVCRNKTINLLRKKRFEVVSDAVSLSVDEKVNLETIFLDHEIRDSQLRMIAACCQFSFSQKNQLIFILRHVAGLSVRELSRGLLMTEEAVAKSIVRSKQLIRENNLTFPPPDYQVVVAQLPSIHLILYLLFNEGYAATEGDSIIRDELCFEAIRLMKLVVDREETATSDSHALLSLFLLHAARFSAREDLDKRLVDLESQNRSLWDGEMVQLGRLHFHESIKEKNYSKYQLEAAIAFEHSRSESFDLTDWPTILELYTLLAEKEPSQAVWLNWLIAVFYSKGGLAAFEKLQELDSRNLLPHNQYYFSLLGKIYLSMEDPMLAASCFRQAIELTTSLPEKKYLEKLLALL